MFSIALNAPFDHTLTNLPLLNKSSDLSILISIWEATAKHILVELIYSSKALLTLALL